MKKILLFLSILTIKQIFPEIKIINEIAALKNELKSNDLVVVKFFAKWCRYCTTMDRMLDEAANEYKNKVKFIKVDIESGQSISYFYRVNAIPTLVFFKKEQETFRMIGFQNSKSLKIKINDLLSNRIKNNSLNKISCNCIKNKINTSAKHI